jgi:hypothetical protein
MTRSMKYLAAALATLVACADAPEDDGIGGAGGGKADGELTTLTFAGDWSERASGPIVAGLPVRVEYDLDRLTACRGSTNGSDVWAITGFASFDGGEPQTFEVTRIVDGRTVAIESELEIPVRAATVEIWFTNTNRWGCNAYDSNEGANYRFDIEARPDVAYAAFEADGAEDLPRMVYAGDQLLVHYAPERLAECAASTGGNAAWSVTMKYQVDGGAIRQVLVTRADGPDLVAADPEIAIPRGHELALWFEATNRWGCHAYDSDGGANYRIAIE